MNKPIKRHLELKVKTISLLCPTLVTITGSNPPMMATKLSRKRERKRQILFLLLKIIETEKMIGPHIQMLV